MCHRRLPNPMSFIAIDEYPSLALAFAEYERACTNNNKEIDMTLPKRTATGSLTTTSPNFGPKDIRHLDVKASDNGGFLVRVFYDNGPSKRTFHYVAVNQPDLAFVLTGIATNRYIDPEPVGTQAPCATRPLSPVRSFL